MDGPFCNLCFKTIPNTYDKFLISGKAKFNISTELKSLSIERKSEHICRTCFTKLKKRRQLLKEIQDIEDLFKTNGNGLTTESTSSKRQSEYNTNVGTPPKRARENSPSLPEVFTSTPSSKARQPRCPLRVRNQEPYSDAAQPKRTVDVKVRVTWPSKEKEIKLPEDLESLGKMLVRGTYKQIANTAWKVPKLKSELVNIILKEIEKETTSLCSRKDPSCLRNTDKNSMKDLTMEKVSKEIKTRAPIFHAVLTTSCTNSRTVERTEASTKDSFPAVAMAAAICLKSRCRNMIAVQLLITTFLYHSNWWVSDCSK